MKQRSWLSVVGIVLAAVALVAGGAWFWVRAHSPLQLLEGAAISSPAAANFVPARSPLMVSWLTNPDRVRELGGVLISPSEKSDLDAALDGVERSLLAGTGLTYDRDVRPWLGDEITFAVVAADADRDADNGKQTGYLAALSVRDADAAREFLDLFWQKSALSGTEVTFEDTSGVRLAYAPDSQRWASALAGEQFVLFANDPDILRRSLHNAQTPTLNLSGSPDYQQALQRLTSRRLGIAFSNLPELTAWLGTASPETRDWGSVTLGLALNREGIEAQAVLSQAAVTEPMTAEPLEVLEYLPPTATLVAAGTDLQQLWQQLQGNPLLSPPLAAIVADIEANWGLSLPEEVFDWARGEYAIALFPNEDGELDWAFIAEKSPETAAAVQKLDAIAVDRGYTIGPFTLKGEHRVFAWTRFQAGTEAVVEGNPRLRLEAEVVGVRGETEGYELLASSIEAIDGMFNARRSGSVLADGAFLSAIAPLGRPNDGYLYVNWPGLRQRIEREWPALRLAELSAKPFFERLQAIGAARTEDEEGARAELFFQLGS